jgi:hypothetical protein
MRKDDITELVQISGFSVADISCRESRRGGRQIPGVRIRLTGDNPCFYCAGCGQYYLTQIRQIRPLKPLKSLKI